jgi:hypothetical protein
MRLVARSAVLVALAAAGCASTLRAGVLAVTDEHGRFGAIASLTAGGGFSISDDRGQDSFAGLVSVNARGGVIDRAPTGELDLDLGIDFVRLWRHLGFRVGALGGGGYLFAPGGGHGVGDLGARAALLVVLNPHGALYPVRPNCWERRAHLLAFEAGVSYLFGPDRALFSFGPVYEWARFEGGSCD